ncbi:MAG TPA: restriction endonuclease subunit S [Prolixibacteraceae bacterium]|nr:restriction endonuclease subunit S [Prolixibacteraceae bacterium]
MKKGWEIKKLGEVCSFYKKQNMHKGLPYVGLENIESNTGRFLGSLEPQTVKSLTFHFSDKHILYGRLRPYLNKVLLPEFEGHCSTEIFPLELTNKLLRKFLFYWLTSDDVVKKIDSTWTGARMPRANMNQVLEFDFGYPPLPEQQRIVSILDEAFAAIDKAKANAEQNLKNARELFESYLQGVFDTTSSPAKRIGWKENTLKELTTKIGSGATPRGGHLSYKTEGISLVRSMNVYDREFRDTNLAFIDEAQAKELAGVTLQANDVLLNITGASVTRCCIFPKEYLPARVNQHVSIIRPRKELLDSRFLNFLLTSKPYKDQLLSTGEQGATRQAITKSQIEALRISIPALDVQKSISHQIEELGAETQKLETIYQQKIANLEELKKSILQKAFAGELPLVTIAEHVELARQRTE